MGLEGAKHYLGSDASEYVKERDKAKDWMGRGMRFLDEVGWMGFAGSTEKDLPKTMTSV